MVFRNARLEGWVAGWAGAPPLTSPPPHPLPPALYPLSFARTQASLEKKSSSKRRSHWAVDAPQTAGSRAGRRLRRRGNAQSALRKDRGRRGSFVSAAATQAAATLGPRRRRATARPLPPRYHLPFLRVFPCGFLPIFIPVILFSSVFCLFMHYLGMQQENGEGHERRVKSPLKTSSSLFSRENEEKRKVEVTEGAREGQVVRCK